MKKVFYLVVALLFVVGLASCGDKGNQVENPEIKVYTRDTTSGTRDGFFSTIGFKDAVSDNTVLVAGYVEVEGNGQMITAVKNDKYGVGYISLSSLEDSGLRGLSYEGVEPTEANVINETYKLTRNFNYAIRNDFDNETEEALVKAFVAYMGTKEGKAAIKGADGIVEIKNTDPSWDDIKADHPVTAQDNSGVTIKFGGSTSVEKVAKALSAEFSPKSGDFVVEHEHTGSGDAFKRAQGSEKDGANKIHIGFASREFKLTDSEQLAEGTYGKLCTDAIVAVVNNDNDFSAVTGEILTKMYNGTFTKWEDVK